MIFLNNFKFILPEIFLSTLILFLLVFGVFLNKIQYKKQYFNGLKNILILILFSLLILFILVYYQYNCDFYILNFHYIGNRFNHFIKSFLVLFTFFIFILSEDFSKYEKEFHFEYYILILLALLGLLLMVSANDFIFLYLSLELQSLSLYVLATSNRYLNKSIEGGLKYFIFGSVASGLFLFGISLLYGLTGLTNFSELSFFLYYNKFNYDYLILLLLSFLFIISGFLFKFSIVPFHNWTPDVYEGAPLLITAFFAIVPKIAIFYIFINFILLFYINFFEIWHYLFFICGIFSIIIGSLGALSQLKIKRLLAYSTISNVGFIFISLSLNTFEGYHAALIYLILYLLLNLSFFSILLCLRKATNKLITNITEISSLFRTNPILSIFLTLNLFSIAGIPPLLGFFSKFYLVFSLIISNMYFTAFICVFVGVYSSIYYIRLIKIMFFEKPFLWSIYSKISKNLLYLLIILNFFNIFFFLFIEIFLNFTRNICIRLIF